MKYDKAIRYDNHSKNAPQALYLFDDDDKLRSSSVLLKSSIENDLAIFLDERYMFIAYEKEDEIYIFINATELKNTTMMIGFSSIDDYYTATLYTKYTHTPEKSGSSEVKRDMEAIRKILAK